MIEIKRPWLATVGGITVDRSLADDVKRSGERLSLRQEANGVQHTTEGHWAGSVNRFIHDTGTPTFMLGYETLRVTSQGKLTNEPATSGTRIRVAQFMPVGEMCLTLRNASGGTETNREALVQIELVGTCVVGASGHDVWLPDPPVLKVLADLYRQLWDSCGIPLQRAGDGTRSVARWDGKAGWFGHDEVPENDHTDPRSLRYQAIFDLAAPKAISVWQVRSGGKTLRQQQAIAGPPGGYTRLINWMNGAGEAKVRAAEKTNGSVSIRKIRVPA